MQNNGLMGQVFINTNVLNNLFLFGKFIDNCIKGVFIGKNDHGEFTLKYAFNYKLIMELIFVSSTST